jgi:hypothetical protein
MFRSLRTTHRPVCSHLQGRFNSFLSCRLRFWACMRYVSVSACELARRMLFLPTHHSSRIPCALFFSIGMKDNLIEPEAAASSTWFVAPPCSGWRRPAVWSPRVRQLPLTDANVSDGTRFRQKRSPVGLKIFLSVGNNNY